MAIIHSTMRKDHFSAYATKYAKFRPQYPSHLLDSICAPVENKKQALDCGTGNGQVACQLAERFETVHGVDISPQQMAQSAKLDNVHYMITPVESTLFADDSFDLVTAAQSYHWFDEDRFWTEIRRITRPGAIVAIWGYQLLRVEKGVDELIDELYYQTLGEKYWDPERRKIEEKYQGIQFPCNELDFPQATLKFEWTADHLIGYLSTWSAVQKYTQAKNTDPLEELRKFLAINWETDEKHAAQFPVFGRMGRIKS